MRLDELKKQIQEQVATEIVYEKPSISYSQFYRYATCPRSWELAYIKKLRVYKPTIHTVFGTSLHETLQHFLTVLFTESVKAAEAIDLPKYLEGRMVENYVAELEKNNNEHFTTPQDLREFTQDGTEILNWVRRRRRIYFGPKGYDLLGIEVPLYLPVDTTVNANVNFLAYVDVILYDKVFNRVKILDIKTSTHGWRKKDKQDAIKKSQVMLYKRYFNQQFNIPFEDIEVEYFIVKRKLYEESDFPQQRIQVFTPSQGKVTLNKVHKWVTDFVSKAFKEDGTYNVNQEYPAVSGPDGEHCKFCEFKDRPDLCPADKRLKVVSFEDRND